MRFDSSAKVSVVDKSSHLFLCASLPDSAHLVCHKLLSDLWIWAANLH